MSTRVGIAGDRYAHMHAGAHTYTHTHTHFGILATWSNHHRRSSCKMVNTSGGEPVLQAKTSGERRSYHCAVQYTPKMQRAHERWNTLNNREDTAPRIGFLIHRARWTGCRIDKPAALQLWTRHGIG